MKKKTKSGVKKVHFSYEERVKIETYLADGLGIRAIARKIERPRSSVSDEIRRNTVKGAYRAEKAKMKTYQRYWRARHQHLKVAMHDGLRKFVREKLKRFWSPEGIAGRLTHIEKELPSLGKDAVYAFVRSPYGGPLGKYLWYRERKRNRIFHGVISLIGLSLMTARKALVYGGFSVIGKPTSLFRASVVRERCLCLSRGKADTSSS